jgi:hypothetical protein
MIVSEKTLTEKLKADLKEHGYRIVNKYNKVTFFQGIRKNSNIPAINDKDYFNSIQFLRVPCDIVAEKKNEFLIVEVKLSISDLHHGIGQLLYYKYLIEKAEDGVKVTGLILAIPANLPDLQKLFLDSMGIQYRNIASL